MDKGVELVLWSAVAFLEAVVPGPFFGSWKIIIW